MVLYLFPIDQHAEDENFYISFFGRPSYGYVGFFFGYFCIINTSTTTKLII